MKPRSKQKRVVVWLGPAFEGDIETLFATPQGYKLLETKPGRESKNGQRKVTLVYQLVDHAGSQARGQARGEDDTKGEDK